MFDSGSELVRAALRYDKGRDPEDTSFLDASTYKPDPDNYIDVIAPLPVFDAAFADDIVAVGREVSNLVADILDAVFAGSVEAMMEWQGIPTEIRSLVSFDSDDRGLLLGRFFCRPDLIVGPDGPLVLEVNFGPSNGSLALVDTVQSRFAETDQGNALTQRGIVLRPPASMKTLTDALERVLRRCAADTSHRHLLVAVATKEEAEEPKGHIVDFCDGLSDVGFDVSLARFSDICADGKTASLGERRIDAIYCMCTFAEIQRRDVPHTLLLDLIALDRAAELDFIGGPAHLLFDNKANLALLHEPIADACYDPNRLAYVRNTSPRPPRQLITTRKMVRSFTSLSMITAASASPLITAWLQQLPAITLLRTSFQMSADGSMTPATIRATCVSVPASLAGTMPRRFCGRNPQTERCRS